MTSQTTGDEIIFMKIVSTETSRSFPVYRCVHNDKTKKQRPIGSPSGGRQSDDDGCVALVRSLDGGDGRRLGRVDRFRGQLAQLLEVLTQVVRRFRLSEDLQMP